MNRRELLASALAAIGVPASVKAIEADPKPLCLVVTIDERCETPTAEQTERIRNAISGQLGPDAPPVLIVMAGMDVKAVRAEVCP